MKHFIIIVSMILACLAAPAYSTENRSLPLYDEAYALVDYINVITAEIDEVEAEHERTLRNLKNQISSAKEELRNLNLQLLSKKEASPCKKVEKLDKNQGLFQKPLNLW